jgi:ABC-type transport system involved in multi-copper enzyme maturation permease subunit
MLRLIIAKELRDIVGSKRFAFSFAVCSILILAAFYVGAVQHQGNTARYETAKSANLKQMEGVTDWLIVNNHRIFLPPQPLASLVAGISNDIGRTTPVGAHTEESQDDSRYSEEPIYAAFRFLDLEFIVQIILSLFAILFTYDAICGEKERGTLKLAFAGPLPRHVFMTGKLIGSLLGLGCPLLIPLLMGSLLFPLLGVSLTPDEWIRLGLIVFAGLLYLAAFLIVGIAVSSMTSRSSSAFLILLVVWIGAVLIVPRGAVLIAGRAVDVPSVDEIGAQLARQSQQEAAQMRRKLAEFKNTSEPRIAIQEFQKFMADISTERAKKTQELASRLNEERANRQSIQEALALGLARISPSASFSLAAADFAGTSLRLKDRYRDAAKTYRESYDKFIFDKTGVNPGGGMVMRVVTDDGTKAKPIDPTELPPFVFQDVTLGEALQAGLVNMGVLVLYCLVFFAVAHRAFVRYDVR